MTKRSRCRISQGYSDEHEHGHCIAACSASFMDGCRHFAIDVCFGGTALVEQPFCKVSQSHTAASTPTSFQQRRTTHTNYPSAVTPSFNMPVVDKEITCIARITLASWSNTQHLQLQFAWRRLACFNLSTASPFLCRSHIRLQPPRRMPRHIAYAPPTAFWTVQQRPYFATLLMLGCCSRRFTKRAQSGSSAFSDTDYDCPISNPLRFQLDQQWRSPRQGRFP